MRGSSDMAGNSFEHKGLSCYEPIGISFVENVLTAESSDDTLALVEEKLLYDRH